MVHIQVPISAEHQTIIAFELVCVNHTAPADLLRCETQQCFGRNIGNHRYLNDTVSLQNSEDRHFPGSTPAPFPLASAAEVALVDLDLSVQQPFGTSGMTQDRQTDGADSPINSPVRQSHLLGHLPDGYFQLKELDER